MGNKPTKPSERTIKKNLNGLRQIVEGENFTPIQKQMAYYAEQVLRWATLETTWGSDYPVKDLFAECEFLEKELAKK